MRETSSRGLVWLAVVVLILASVALHTYHFHDRNFREDEIYTVHAARMLTLSEVVQWMGGAGVHPAGWRVLATGWVKLTGTAEPVARYFSTLCTLLALALLYRLGTDLFDRQIGFFAVFLLGTLPFAQFFMHELRPYAALVLIAAGLLWAFVRWLDQPNFVYALLYVGFGVAGLQTHYFTGYLVAAQAIFFVLLVRWDRVRYLRAVGLWFAIGLSLTAWMLPILNRTVVGAGGMSYALPVDRAFLGKLHDQMQIAPHALGQLLLLFGLVMPVSVTQARRSHPPDELFRLSPEWRKLYLLFVPGGILAIAVIANEFVGSVTARNLIVMLPSLAILAALGLRRLPWQARIIILLLIAYPALTTFRTYRGNGPYRQIVAFMEPAYSSQDRMVFHINDSAAGTQALLYYLEDHLSLDKHSVYHIGGSAHSYAFDEPVNRTWNSTPDTLAKFETFLGTAERVWYIHHNSAPLAKPFVEILEAHYALVRSADFTDDRFKYGVTEYRRIPESAQDLFHFGEAVSLQAWTLRESVNVEPCQAVTLESWWTALSQPEISYGIGLVLADAGGNGIAQTDDLPSGLLTSEWKPGNFQFDTRTLRIPCDVGPGEYPLLIGLFDYATTEPVPAALPDGTPARSSLVYLTTLIVD